MVARVLIMAGGTGGHVFPALAVANELRARGAEVVWMGTRHGMEAEIVPRAGIEMEWVSIAGLRGNGALGWVLAPLRLARACAQALGILLRRRPTAILGMGGFVSGPGGFVTWLVRKPLLIHEQNAIAGLTNRLLSRLADQVLEGFPNTFSGKRVHTVGNPVRADIAALAPPAERYRARNDALRVLVVGGSLGAQALNDAMPQALALLPEAQRPQVWHQTGKRNIEAARAAYATAAVTARVEPFIDEMAAAYGWADLVICRAGALTIAELAAAGVASVLVPYPHAVDDHQTANAAFLQGVGAAILLPQPQLSAAGLKNLLLEFGADAMQGRRRLLAMAEAARGQARTDATARVATLCMEAAHG